LSVNIFVSYFTSPTVSMLVSSPLPVSLIYILKLHRQGACGPREISSLQVFQTKFCMHFCSPRCVSQSAISLAFFDHRKNTLCLESSAYSEGLGWIAVQSMWDLWWTE